MVASKSDRDVVSNQGFYYCCYKLSALGFLVEPSSFVPRNRTLDIEKPNGGDAMTVKVKALKSRAAAGFGSSLEGLNFDYLVVVNMHDDSEPTGYVLKIDELRTLMNRNEKDGRISYWLEIRDYENDKFKNAWSRIQPS